MQQYFGGVRLLLSVMSNNMVTELLRCPFLFSLSPDEFHSAPRDHQKRKLLAGKMLRKE